MEAFVYKLTNVDKNKHYIGYHKGSTDDGYVCSSSSEEFWNDWENDNWKRDILFEGTQSECVKKEIELLRQMDLTKNYNNSVAGHIIFTEEVRNKMRKAHNKNRNYAKGWKFTEESKKKLSNSHKKFVSSLSESERKAHYKQNKNLDKLTESNNSSAKCPHCDKVGQYRAMKRWHFDNCKDNV